MKRSPIPPHPVLNMTLIEQVEFDPVVTFASYRADPGARGKWGEQYTLGHDSDWDPDRDELKVLCNIDGIRNVGLLFGPNGVAPRSATLLLALEWCSSDSGWRILGEPALLRMPEQSAIPVPTQLLLTLPANTLRGTGSLSLQLLLGDAGAPKSDEKGLARIPGFRFGMLGSDTHLVIDGDGSLFPVVVESFGVDEPLWRFTQDWSDPSEDEFSTVWLSLSLNESHPDFPLLRERGVERWTPLFCQVMASWLATFLMELKAEPGVEFDAIALGRPAGAVRGSIVDAAASMVKRGNLDCSSHGELINSIQIWIDATAREMK
jgi:hypothetical protein